MQVSSCCEAFCSRADSLDDAQLMARLAGISVKDENPQSREHALKLLKTLFDNRRVFGVILRERGLIPNPASRSLRRLYRRILAEDP